MVQYERSFGGDEAGLRREEKIKLMIRTDVNKDTAVAWVRAALPPLTYGTVLVYWMQMNGTVSEGCAE